MKKLDKFFEKFADRLIWFLIAIYVSIFSYICFLKYFSFSYYDWDFANNVLVLWNSLHGRLAYDPFLEQSVFGGHLALIIFLILPIFAIFQHPLTLLFLQSLFLGLGAYPLYLLAKTKINKTFALALGLSYLLYPSLGFINLFETHMEIFAIFFIFFALYFFEKEKFYKFLIFLLLALSCKENISLPIFMLGIYALLRKRTKRWVLVPLILGPVWFLSALKLIIPYFSKYTDLYQGGFMFNLYYQHLGSSLSDMIKNLISHPVYFAKFALTPPKIGYICRLFMSTGFVGFLSPSGLLMTVPIFMQNLLSLASNHFEIKYHYTAILIPFIFFSTTFAFKKLLSYRLVHNHRGKLLLVFLLISISSGIYLRAPQLFLRDYFKSFKIDDISKEKKKITSGIPQQASVMATFQFLPHLANRHNLCSSHFVNAGFKMYTNVKYTPPQNLEFLLIDFNEPTILTFFFSQRAQENVRNFLENENWRILRAFDDVVLFKKDYPQGQKLFEEVKEPQAQNLLNIKISDQIEFIGYDLAKDNKNKDNLLHFTFYWKRLEKPQDKLGLYIQFLGSAGAKFEKAHAFGYRVYSPSSWPGNAIFKEQYYILIPSDVKEGDYDIRACVFNLENKKILPSSKDGKIINEGMIPLGKIAIHPIKI